MTEGEEHLHHKPHIEFGHPLHKRERQSWLFPNGEDLPLFSGTPQPVIDQPFAPEAHTWKQATIPDLPAIDYDAVLARDKQLRRRKRAAPVPDVTGDIFTASVEAAHTTDAAVPVPPTSDTAPAYERPLEHDEHAGKLREALAPYLNLQTLRKLAGAGTPVREALRSDTPPEEVLALLDVLSAILRPVAYEQISSPADVAALLMVEMSHLTQEQLRVVCLTTKNQVQKIHMVYQGSVNSSPVRIAEVFREPIKLNSAGIITAHNHPSGQPDPSPEDIVLTRQLVEAGKLLSIEVLDHLVIGQGRWVSLRERRLGFDC